MRFKNNYRSKNSSTLFDVNLKKCYATLYHKRRNNGIGFSTGSRGNRIYLKYGCIGGRINTETGLFKLKRYNNYKRR